MALMVTWIIPYQEKLGNYNGEDIKGFFTSIIPYQEKLGNYNSRFLLLLLQLLYHTKKN